MEITEADLKRQVEERVKKELALTDAERRKVQRIQYVKDNFKTLYNREISDIDAIVYLDNFDSGETTLPEYEEFLKYKYGN